MKSLSEKYWAPTPKKWRKIGDALLAASGVITTSAIVIDIKWLAASALIIGFAGKFLSNCFTEDNQKFPSEQ